MRKSDSTVGIVGALSAFPRRLAARAVGSKGSRLRRGLTRHTGTLVLGRTLLDKLSDAEIELKVATLRDTDATLLRCHFHCRIPINIFVIRTGSWQRGAACQYSR